MENAYTFEMVFAILVLLAGGIAAYYFIYFKQKESRKIGDDYIKGLKAAVQGDHRQAIMNFKEAVRQNSENIDAYIKLAGILKKENLIKNAVRIYKDLLLRGTLSVEEEYEIKYQLAVSYLDLGQTEQGKNIFESLKTDKTNEKKIKSHLVRLYEMENNWQKAYDTYKLIPNHDKKKLAYFRTMHGKEIQNKNELKESRIIYKDAIKADPGCAEAYLMIGDTYILENRTGDAISTWTEFCKKVPEKAFMAFERLEKAWYEKGQFSKIEELYLSILEKNENDLHAFTALAEIYRKKGEYGQAVKILQDAQKKEVDQQIISFHLARINADQGNYKVAAKQALELLENTIGK